MPVPLDHAIAMASIHQDLIDRICVTDNAVLEYDSVTNDLRTWPW